MAKHTVRFPQKGDRVGAIGREGVFVVIGVHENPNMADLRPLKGRDGTGTRLRGRPHSRRQGDLCRDIHFSLRCIYWPEWWRQLVSTDTDLSWEVYPSVTKPLSRHADGRIPKVSATSRPGGVFS